MYVIRLQNLPWSASASDVRTFFSGLDIPNGGVRIIGGDEGDCFVVFSSATDATDALSKNGYWLNDQQIKLVPSSEEQMQYITAIAKGEIPVNPVGSQPGVPNINPRSFQGDSHSSQLRADDLDKVKNIIQNVNRGVRDGNFPFQGSEPVLNNDAFFQDKRLPMLNNRTLPPSNGLMGLVNNDQRNSFDMTNRPDNNRDLTTNQINKELFNQFAPDGANRNISSRNIIQQPNQDNMNRFGQSFPEHGSERMNAPRNIPQPLNQENMNRFNLPFPEHGSDRNSASRNIPQQLNQENMNRFNQPFPEHGSDRMPAPRNIPQQPNQDNMSRFNPSIPQNASDRSSAPRNVPQPLIQENTNRFNPPNPQHSSERNPAPRNMPQQINQDNLNGFNQMKFQNQQPPGGFGTDGQLSQQRPNINASIPPNQPFIPDRSLDVKNLSYSYPNDSGDFQNVPPLNNHLNQGQRFSQQNEPASRMPINAQRPLEGNDGGLFSQQRYPLSDYPSARTQTQEQLNQANQSKHWSPNNASTRQPASNSNVTPAFGHSQPIDQRSMRAVSGHNQISSDSDMRRPSAGPPPQMRKAGLLPTPAELPNSSGEPGPTSSVNGRGRTGPANQPELGIGIQNRDGRRNRFSGDMGEQQLAPSDPKGPRPRFPSDSMEPRMNQQMSMHMPEGHITDPCAVITQLTTDVKYKHIRALFATHDIKALNIVILYPDMGNGPTKAYALFDDVHNASLAVKELNGMKVAGCTFFITPCSRAEYEHHLKLSTSQKPPSRRMHSPPHNQDADGRRMSEFNSNQEQFERPRNQQIEHRDRNPYEDHRAMPQFNPNQEQFDRTREQFDRTRNSHMESRDRLSNEDQRPQSHQDKNRDRRDRSPIDRRRSRASPSRGDTDNRHRRSNRSRSPPIRNRRSSGDRYPRKSPPGRNSQIRPLLQETERITAAVSQVSATSSSWCIIITGLPPKTTEKDLEEFLTPAKYDRRSLYIESNIHKECTGTAYAELLSEGDQRALVSVQRELLGQAVTVTSISRGQMVDNIDKHKKHLSSDKTKPGEFVIQLSGLPNEATPQVVREFLYPAKFKDSDVTIVKRADGRCCGTAFTKVHTIEDRDEAVKHDRGYIGKRYVSVKVISQALMDEYMSKQDTQQTEPVDLPGKNPDLDRTINMVNLRYDVKAEQIEEFFKDFDPEKGSVKFIMNNGMPTGRGSVKMLNADSAQRAVKALCKTELAGRSLLLNIATM